MSDVYYRIAFSLMIVWSLVMMAVAVIDEEWLLAGISLFGVGMFLGGLVLIGKRENT